MAIFSKKREKQLSGRGRFSAASFSCGCPFCKSEDDNKIQVEMTIDDTLHSYNLLAETLHDADGTSISITCAMLKRSDH